MTGCRPCIMRFIMIDATFRYGSSYFCLGPMMLCGTAITYSTQCVSHRFLKNCSTASFPIPYGIGKLAVEQFLRNLCETHCVEYVIAVPHNIIGPRQKYDDPYRNVASIMMNLMMQKRQPVIYGDGSQERCFS